MKQIQKSSHPKIKCQNQVTQGQKATGVVNIHFFFLKFSLKLITVTKFYLSTCRHSKHKPRASREKNHHTKNKKSIRVRRRKHQKEFPVSEPFCKKYPDSEKESSEWGLFERRNCKCNEDARHWLTNETTQHESALHETSVDNQSWVCKFVVSVYRSRSGCCAWRFDCETLTLMTFKTWSDSWHQKREWKALDKIQWGRTSAYSVPLVLHFWIINYVVGLRLEILKSTKFESHAHFAIGLKFESR